jgi:serine-type D-Ala-D-Ala carboxypeptidase/endopeptidase (penicillin-binding protein 4)
VRRVVVGALVVVLLAGGYAVADAEDLVPGVLTLSAPTSPTATPRPTPTPSWPPTTAAQAVLAQASTTAPTPSPTALARQLSSIVRALGSHAGVDVMDVATGQTLYARAAATPRAPASTTKILTAAALLSAMEPDATLPTTVVQGRTTSGTTGAVTQVVLVGGGDTQLAVGAGSPLAVFGRAGIGDLATATAKALQNSGLRRVTVGFDDSMFSGPTLSPQWARGDAQQGLVGPVTALGLAAKAPRLGRPAPADPSLVTAQAFAKALGRAGLTTTGPVRRVRAPTGAPSLAVVRSAPVRDLLGFTLDTSDNTEAEVLARIAAHAAGRTASFVGAAANNIRVAAALGAPVTGTRLYDGSGLARADLIAPQTLAVLLTKTATAQRTELQVMFAGLPVAGYTGTLANRFQDTRTRVGAGVVRAKTGTLRGVNTLAGITVDADGRLLAFAFMADHGTGTTVAARELVDRAVSLLAACGCR